MSRPLSWQSALLALSGCTAAILVSQQAQAYTTHSSHTNYVRAARPPVSRPSFRPVIQPRQVFSHPGFTFSRQPLTVQRFQHPQSFAGFSHPLMQHLPRPNSFGGFRPQMLPGSSFHPNFAHAPSFFHPTGTPAFNRSTYLANLPRPNSFGSNVPRFSALAPQQNRLPTTSLSGPHLPFGSHPTTFAHIPLTTSNPNQHLAGQTPNTVRRSNTHSLLGDLGNVVSSVGKEAGDIGNDVLKGKVQNIPGDVLKDGGKVAGNVIKTGTNIFTLPPPKLPPEQQKMTTSDPSGFNTPNASNWSNTQRFIANKLAQERINKIMEINKQREANAGNVHPGTGSGNPVTHPCDPIACDTHPNQGSQGASNQNTPNQNKGTGCGIRVLCHPGQGGVVFNVPLRPRFPRNPNPDQQPSSGTPVSSSSGSGGSAGAPSGSAPVASDPGSYTPPAQQYPIAQQYQPAPAPIPAPQMQTPVVNQSPIAQQAPATATTLAVLFQANLSGADMAAFLQAYKATVVEGPASDGSYKLQLSTPIPADQLQQVIDSMKGQTNIVSAVAAI